MEWIATGISASAEREPAVVSLEGVSVLVVGEGNGWWALEDRCTHADCAFSTDGEVDGSTIICSCHGSEFDIRTGEVLAPPAHEPITCFPVRIREGDLEVYL